MEVANMKKRSSDFKDSNYFKIRAIVKDLRPQFIEVLKTPDFQTSKAASVINEQMKLLMKLYEEMTSETISLEKCKNVANVSHDQKKSTEVKPVDPPVKKEETFIRKPSEERPIPEKQDVTQPSYIVGGSAFGWNFITYPSSKLSGYYGRTKEDFRAANPIPTDPVPTDPVPIV
ncbi:hypothetical protein CTI12_AA320140 [Artemisia annua]|uniref:Uncharacterized protein n=1 Tax=Artemisia annua TaxID=35608 RepID=A0A2U1N0U9_ARTAN|nr:hypothetical protein CTI12_AA320140 [Artemisia annua]